MSAIGLNFVPSSKRHIDLERARDIVAEVQKLDGPPPQIIGVFANQPLDFVAGVASDAGLDGVQLHGDETTDELSTYLRMGLFAYKAVRIENADDVLMAAFFPGDRVLLDAKVGAELGGTGHTFDWSLLGELSRVRRIVLAGGLTPENVADAVKQVRPYGVDTASGVESAPGIKDEGLVRAFLSHCHDASS